MNWSIYSIMINIAVEQNANIRFFYISCKCLHQRKKRRTNRELVGWVYYRHLFIYFVLFLVRIIIIIISLNETKWKRTCCVRSAQFATCWLKKTHTLLHIHALHCIRAAFVRQQVQWNAIIVHTFDSIETSYWFFPLHLRFCTMTTGTQTRCCVWRKRHIKNGCKTHFQ